MRAVAIWRRGAYLVFVLGATLPPFALAAEANNFTAMAGTLALSLLAADRLLS